MAELGGDYTLVWSETNKAIAEYDQTDIDAILGGTAAFYGVK